jgi:hypothetical protein
VASIEADAFRGRLLPDERIIWSGRPATGVILTLRDLFLIPFSVFWCGFAILWTALAWGGGAGPFALFGLFFVAFGLIVMVGRFGIDAWLRQGMSYALTDKRVLILKNRPTIDFTAISLDRLPEARVTERGDGRGTVRFGPQRGLLTFGGTGFSIWVPSLDPTPQFLAIADARRVFDLVQRSSK